MSRSSVKYPFILCLGLFTKQKRKGNLIRRCVCGSRLPIYIGVCPRFEANFVPLQVAIIIIVAEVSGFQV